MRSGKERKEKKEKGAKEKRSFRFSLSGFTIALCVTFAFAWLFFHSFRAVIVTFPAGIVLYRDSLAREEQARMGKRRDQCKDALLSMSASLSAGYALENAITSAKEVSIQVWGEDSLIVKECTAMEAGMSLHIPVEDVFMEFAEHMELPELTQLAGLLSIAKRSGGRLGALMNTCATQMEERMQVESEIRTHLTEKKMELYIMLVMPPAVLLYLQLCSYNIVAPLYETMWGHGFMLVCLVIYGLGWWLGMRILDVRMK